MARLHIPHVHVWNREMIAFTFQILSLWGPEQMALQQKRRLQHNTE